MQAVVSVEGGIAHYQAINRSLRVRRACAAALRRSSSVYWIAISKTNKLQKERIESSRNQSSGGCFYRVACVGCTPVRLVPLQVLFSFRVVKLIV